jgi:predicted transposase YdaD
VSVITKAQDKFFKSVFSRKEIVTELFQKTLSEEVLPKLNLAELELVSGSFVDGRLKEHYADLVYRCPFTGQGEVQLVLLLEHKSYQESYPHFRRTADAVTTVLIGPLESKYQAAAKARFCYSHCFLLREDELELSIYAGLFSRHSNAFAALFAFV